MIITNIIADYNIGYNEETNHTWISHEGYLAWCDADGCEDDRELTDDEIKDVDNWFGELFNNFEIPAIYKDAEYLCIYVNGSNGDYEARLEGFGGSEDEFVYYID